jgi:hypothetical protein
MKSKTKTQSKIIRMTSFVLSYFSIINFVFLLNLVFHPQTKLFSQNSVNESITINKDTLSIDDTSNSELNADLFLPLFSLIDRDTITLGPNDELVTDHYTAFGKPAIYDALHSFNYRRSDKFGGYINDKVNAGLERIRRKGFKSDIKRLYIQINPLTLTVYWFAVVGPSQDGNSYVRIDSRGSAGGYLKAVEKQLPRMHRLYPDLMPVKFLEFNENVIACYSWDGRMLDNYCSSVNIQQHFFKYRKRYDDEISLKPESRLELIFGEQINLDTLNKEQILLQDSTQNNNSVKVEKKIEDKKVAPKKKPSVKTYKVKAGDTLSEIAEKYRTSVSKIKKLNRLNSDNLRIGQILKISL